MTHKTTSFGFCMSCILLRKSSKWISRSSFVAVSKPQNELFKTGSLWKEERSLFSISNRRTWNMKIIQSILVLIQQTLSNTYYHIITLSNYHKQRTKNKETNNILTFVYHMSAVDILNCIVIQSFLIDGPLFLTKKFKIWEKTCLIFFLQQIEAEMEINRTLFWIYSTGWISVISFFTFKCLSSPKWTLAFGS